MTTQNLPSVANAKLPATYENAKLALSQCSAIDECKDWADKAEALASYAKQADDHSLRRMADRIQARAVRRAGELLRQIDGRPGNAKKQKEGDLPLISQKQAATDAGLSEYQRKTAVRVANVPESDFEQQVESDAPPTVTNLAKQGTKPRFLDNPNGKNYARVAQTMGMFRQLNEFVNTRDAVEVAKELDPQDVKKLRKWDANIQPWMDRFFTALGGE